MSKKTHDEWLNYYIDKFKVSGKRVVGVGVTAFNRIGPALFYPNYEIVCYKDSGEVDEVKKYCMVHSIQKDFLNEGDIEKLNTASILKHEGVRNYINRLDDDARIFVYKASLKIYSQVEKLGLKIIGNHPSIRDQFENKKEFFQIGRQIGLPMILGEQWEIDSLDNDVYEHLIYKIGRRLVFQLTEITLGGGKGTFFIKSLNDFKNFQRFVFDWRKKRKLQYVNVTKFISGPSPSITGCVTKHGILTGVVQTQVLDVSEINPNPGRMGVFQGHDWSYRQYPDWVQSQADKIAIKLGEYMHKRGYKGVFGIDLIVDEEEKKVYPVECNPRYTGAFPVYSLLQKKYGEVPLDIFQMLELLDMDYDMDFEMVNKKWKQPKEGAHFVLVNPNESWAEVRNNVLAGVYRYANGRLEWLRSGVLFEDLHNDDEFILTDGVPRVGQKIKPHFRMGKLMFKGGVLKKPGVLNDFSLEVLAKIQEQFNLKEKYE